MYDILHQEILNQKPSYANEDLSRSPQRGLYDYNSKSTAVLPAIRGRSAQNSNVQPAAGKPRGGGPGFQIGD